MTNYTDAFLRMMEQRRKITPWFRIVKTISKWKVSYTWYNAAPYNAVKTFRTELDAKQFALNLHQSDERIDKIKVEHIVIKRSVIKDPKEANND